MCQYYTHASFFSKPQIIDTHDKYHKLCPLKITYRLHMTNPEAINWSAFRKPEPLTEDERMRGGIDHTNGPKAITDGLEDGPNPSPLISPTTGFAKARNLGSL